MKFFSNFFANFYWELGLDLGSSNIKIYLKDKGVVVDEASMVARLKKKKNGVQKILIFGQKRLKKWSTGSQNKLRWWRQSNGER